MCVENLKQLNVWGNNAHQVAFILDLKLCWSKLSERRKYTVSNKCKQLKRNKVIAFLLSVAQQAADQGKYKHASKEQHHRGRWSKAHSAEQRICTKNANERGGKIA